MKSDEVLRMAMRSSKAGTMRPVAEFLKELAPDIAHHASEICRLSPGAEYNIQTTGGKPVKTIPTPIVVQTKPNDLERAIAVAIEQGYPLSAVKKVALAQYGITEEQWAAVSWKNIQS